MVSEHVRLAIGTLAVVAIWPLAGSAQPLVVSDPLLEPPPPGAIEVRTWNDALARIRQSPDLLTEVEQVARTRAQERIALAAVLPRLDLTGSYIHNFNTQQINIGALSFQSPPPTIWSAGVNVQWSVVSPRGIYLVGIARLETNIEELTLADRRRLLAANAVALMLNTVAAGRIAEQNRVSLRASLERLELTRARLQFARGTDLDVDRASQDVAASRALVINGDEALRESREDLARVLGSSTPIGVVPDVDLGQLERELATTCHLGKSIEDRADIIAARQRVKIGNEQITAAKLLYLPTIALSSGAADASATTLGPKETWNVSAILSLPIYDGGARRATLRAAAAATRQAIDILASARIEASIEAARASRAIGVTTAERDVSRQQRDLARRIDERTRQGYSAGVGTSLDLVTSAQNLRDAEIQLIIAELRVAQARANAILVTAECVY